MELAVDPRANVLRIGRRDVYSLAIILAYVPVAFIPRLVWECKDPVSLSVTRGEVALIPTPVSIHHDAQTFGIAELQSSFELGSVRKLNEASVVDEVLVVKDVFINLLIAIGDVYP